MKKNPNIYTVSFFGPREIPDSDISKIGDALRRLIRKLLRTKENVRFLVMRRGIFDLLVTAAVYRVREEPGCRNCSLILVLPYVTDEYRYNKYLLESCYDEIKICRRPITVNLKRLFRRRVRRMIRRSDLVVCYIQHESGEVYQTIKYAKKQKKKICGAFGNKF
ncbi:MAG: hypothetical protein K2N56_00895 [Oscillospiraceae bacterium]|nr:hypothetical protein [Oscillospiraceae bacterium]